MFLAAQYYRPPFPHGRYWADDMARMRDAGLHALQLWCIWGWIESEPGVYRYDDYDELMTVADKAGLKVVLSTIAEIHPFWIHRLVPDSPMVDERGHRVVSAMRNEVNCGLTPGGCTDNPRVAEMMESFLVDLAGRYASASNLIGYDAWNETRWCVHSDGHVCYCPHTLAAFRQWLSDRHGGLEGLSAAWQRRYTHWDDVMPGKYSGRPYTDQMEFMRFLSWRSAMHLRMRYRAIRSADSEHFISAHCGQPAILSGGGPRHEQALCRGVDWDLADEIDGFGCSHFPFWWTFADEAFGIRVEQVRSANRGKPTWVSELQGGSSRGGFVAMRSVEAGPQQRWIYSAMGRGAKAVIFWCWRDEVFGCESSGFGLNGWDGLAHQRLEAMAKTGELIDRHAELIDAYQPAPAKVGVFFARDNYYLDFAQYGKPTGAQESVTAYCTALEKLKVPYDLVEGQYLDALEGLDVLLMPWAMVVPEEAREAIVRFLRRGGTVLMEAETDSFDCLGFYRYPDERPLMQAIGLSDLGRRHVQEGQTLLAELPGRRDVELDVSWMTTPLNIPGDAQVLARNPADEPLIARRAVGKGQAWVVGTMLGGPYGKNASGGLETLLTAVLDQAGVRNDLGLTAGDGDEGLLWRTGSAGKKRMLWIINTGRARTVTVTDQANLMNRKTRAQELVTGQAIGIRTRQGVKSLEVPVPAGGWAVLAW